MRIQKIILSTALPAAVVFATLLIIGIVLANHKPLWNDELHTQINVIEKSSYSKILSGQIDEGNNFPLFYLSQKSFLDIIRYRFPEIWDGEWRLVEPRSQILLRVLPIIFMSVAITAIFQYFRKYSRLAAIYALGLTLSCINIWAFWAEARPYSLWIMLTTFQCLLFLDWLNQDKPAGRHAEKWLAIINTLLALTVSLSVLQIAIVSIFLWKKTKQPNSPGLPSGPVLSRPRRGLKKYFGLTILPLLLCLFYFSRTPRISFRIYDIRAPFEANFPPELLAAFYIAAGFILLLYRREKIAMPVSLSQFINFVSWYLLAAVAVLAYFKLRCAPGTEGFEVNSRYLLFLTPLSIIAVNQLLSSALKAAKQLPWVYANIIIVFTGIIILRGINTVSDIINLDIYF